MLELVQFIVVIFMLDWAKAGLANAEAVALMHRCTAPPTATVLMWHTDNKWANPLWWLRALRGEIVVLLSPREHGKKETVSRPGSLWYCLSFVMLLLFIALPLSGLTMEVTSAQVRTANRARIFGPNATTFNQRSIIDMEREIRSNWRSGRPTSPLQGALLYAPNGTDGASDLYFNDKATQYAESIEFFAGPAVHETIAGRAWGMWANISCLPVHKHELQMLQIDNFTFSVNPCVYNWCDGEATEGSYCNPIGFTETSSLPVDFAGHTCAQELAFPRWYNKTASSNLFTGFSFILVVDGAVVDHAEQYSPYIQDDSHDMNTYDSVFNNRSQQEPTTAMLEFFIWEGSSSKINDTVLANLTSGRYPGPVEILNHPLNEVYPDERPNFAGIAVHCEITSAVGYADLDPAHRTFSRFRPSRAASNSELYSDQNDVDTPQYLALRTLTRDEDQNEDNEPLGIIYAGNQTHPWAESDDTWFALHTAVGSSALAPDWSQVDPSRTDGPQIQFHALTPQDVQLAMYKLLGESVIELMGEGGIDQYEENLYAFETRSYLTTGAVPWILVLIILTLWAVLMSGSAVWIFLFAGRRWAPSLNGFEMFKFGAQYAGEVDELEDIDFQGCKSVLDRVPGMVGMLPGTGGRQSGPGFVGLSENEASRDAEYTLDRRQAAVVRPGP
ncbi:hypothetical protein N0V90_012103 [Kalmusia sp. IMI 367209]|nr:hypothetical protein N0V90_012103 [Kalmusia sp. IMI 367209]